MSDNAEQPSEPTITIEVQMEILRALVELYDKRGCKELVQTLEDYATQKAGRVPSTGENTKATQPPRSPRREGSSEMRVSHDEEGEKVGVVEKVTEGESQEPIKSQLGIVDKDVLLQKVTDIEHPEWNKMFPSSEIEKDSTSGGISDALIEILVNRVKEKKAILDEPDITPSSPVDLKDDEERLRRDYPNVLLWMKGTESRMAVLEERIQKLERILKKQTLMLETDALKTINIVDRMGVWLSAVLTTASLQDGASGTECKPQTSSEGCESNAEGDGNE